ncbi:TPA: ead/Ea22-like family protein [Escherichia coli]|nr:ead/Ea22-like family protein [Escherichia coli]HDV3725373.1 ead/Ea22-like family protein [Escherichia coli]HDV3746759.1 ead/Ea22-like family protein [Escherichia coli]
MSVIHSQALREAAEQAMHDNWGFDADLFHELVTPSIVLTLLDERERNQQYIKRRDQENEDIALTVGKLRVELEAAENNLIDSECHVAELEEALRDKQALLEASEKRIAELEARKILLPERISMLHRTDFHDDYQTVMAYKVSEVIAAIRAAGIRIKGE